MIPIKTTESMHDYVRRVLFLPPKFFDDEHIDWLATCGCECEECLPQKLRIKNACATWCLVHERTHTNYHEGGLDP